MRVPTIETPRLTLRGFATEDLDRLATILGDPDVMRYMPGGQPLSRERAEAQLRSILDHWEKNAFGWWAVICNADKRLIGWCGLTLLDETSEIEVAYLLASAYWGQGYATEAARVSLRYAFEELQLDRIIALAIPENGASRRVMEKIGMQYDAPVHYFGLDVVRYTINRDAFKPGEALFILKTADN